MFLLHKNFCLSGTHHSPKSPESSVTYGKENTLASIINKMIELKLSLSLCHVCKRLVSNFAKLVETLNAVLQKDRF